MDGFRFDLMGLIDVDTMNAVRAALDEIPGRGRDILMYGEPWSAGATAPLPSDTVLAEMYDATQSVRDDLAKTYPEFADAVNAVIQ